MIRSAWSRPLLPTLLILAGTSASAQDALVKPAQERLVLATEHLRALVPAGAAEALKPRIARAEAIYQRIARDSGYTISEPLWLIVSDDVDSHNGFSSTVPRAIVQIELAPSPERSQLFVGGDDEFERTLVHELTHHVSNDRSYGFNGFMAKIFGRVYPYDLLSLPFGFITVPTHVTMPSFWHEGTAQWAETAYADPTSPWAGRGRDSLTHMVWRLDAAAEAIPPVDDWRQTYQQWPFGNRVYLYGLAYTRWLEAAYGSDPGIWALIDEQAHQGPFQFDGGPEELLGQRHRPLIDQARRDLLAEQRQQLARIRSQPLTALRRLTPKDSLAGAPGWLPDGTLLFGYNDNYRIPSLAVVKPDAPTPDTVDRLGGLETHDRGEVRTLPDGTAVFAESVGSGTDEWSRSRVVVRGQNGSITTYDIDRVIQPDVRHMVRVQTVDHHPNQKLSGANRQYPVAGILLKDGGQQELVLLAAPRIYVTSFIPIVHSFKTEPVQLPTQGRPWHPTFRPINDDLAWVESDHDGCRLVLAPLADPTARTVLAQVRGRLIHPVWTRDGASLFVCSDVSGVSNAYRIDVANPGVLVPVTNVEGGVIACVPSNDNRTLALTAFDRRGPFIATIANDPATFPPALPSIALAWPAVLAGQPVPTMATNGGTSTEVQASQPSISKSASSAKSVEELGLPTAGSATASVPAVPASTGRFRRPEPLGVGYALASGPVVPEEQPYHGWQQMRPLFWTPTTLVTPWGGLGVAGFLADPVYTWQAAASVGLGDEEGTVVGFAGLTAQPDWIAVSLSAWRNERTYSDRIYGVQAGQWYTYSENQTTGQLRLGYHLAGSERRFQAAIAGGLSDWQGVDTATERYAGQTLLGATPFTGHERYVELQLGYNNSRYFPTSYTAEDGFNGALTARHSGLGGEYQNRRVLGQGSYVWSLWKEGGHQLVTAGSVGWSDPDATRWLQGAFSIGGTSDGGTPRGYQNSSRTGAYLLGWSLAYRLPLWRPFTNWGTTPFSFRQLVLEPFYDGGHVSQDHVNGDGDWLRSTGAELHGQFEVWALDLNPGVGVAKELDGREDTNVYLTLDYQW